MLPNPANGKILATPASAFYTLLYVLLVLGLGACASTDMPEFEGTPDYTEVYHPIINVAELNIVRGEYDEALTAYEQAFVSVPSAFARDYYNAAVSAVQLQDEEQAVGYLEQLVLKGVSLEYLERQQVFDSLRMTKEWRKLERRYPKLRSKFEETLNKELRADLDELYARDAYFRMSEGGLRAHGDTIREIENANVENLLAWIEEYGYPGENLIGVADTLEQLPRFSIVIQRQTKARKGYDFKDILTKAVQEGRMAPQPVAYLLDQQAGDNLYGSRAFVTVKCTSCKEEDEKPRRYLVKEMSEAKQAGIDKRRTPLGLEPLEDYRTKVLFGLRNPAFRLNYDWSVVEYKVPSKEAASVLLENLTAADPE
ncbi:hypothetical protein [Pontibacter russatus]|uniref:hypothetical protein n=1 Tax=Pontibacter russatus TaxID=2694929 RepID=UPI0013798983|nr:hypothetical protein [Pontibacter russatus]